MSKYKPRLSPILKDLMIELVDVALDQPSPTKKLTNVLDRISAYKTAREHGTRTFAVYRQSRHRAKLKALKRVLQRHSKMSRS